MIRTSSLVFRVLSRAALLGLIAISLHGVSAAGTGQCATTRVDEPFVLPDGSEHPAGIVTLCHDRKFNPVSSLHTMYVDHMPVGLFRSHPEVTDDANETGYFMLFARGADRPLRLVGYGLPGRGGSRTHVLDRPRVVVKQFIDQAKASAPSNETIVLVPAFLD